MPMRDDPGDGQLPALRDAVWGSRWPSTRTSIRPINRRPSQPWMNSSPGWSPRASLGGALGELGVDLIPGPLPRPRGGWERLFHTFQDRLIRRCAWRGLRPPRRPIASWRTTCRSTTGALRSSRPRPPICIGRGRRVVRWTGFCASRRPGACGRTEPSRITGTLSDSRHPPGRAGAGGRARGWDDAAHAQGPGARLPRHHVSGLFRRRQSTRSPHSGARSRRGRTIRGAHGCCLNTNDPRRPKPKTGHFYFGRKRTFLSWLDTDPALH